MSKGIVFWPEQASAHAVSVDWLIASFGAMVWLLTLPVFVFMILFVWRYRRTQTVNREHAPTHNMWVELSWSGIPFILTIIFYIWATSLYADLRAAPANPLTINVVAKQWMWKFQHPEGPREINNLHVPAGQPVKLVMTSQDVVHSLYFPALRIKEDVVPGTYTMLWFNANKPGRYPLRCAEFCGADHSTMGGALIVMDGADYTEWLDQRQGEHNNPAPAEQGARLFRQNGCAACHNRSNNAFAPALTGLFGTPVSLSGGAKMIADERYLRRAIMLPNAEVVMGYRPIMPSYANTFDEEQINALIAYLKTDMERHK